MALRLHLLTRADDEFALNIIREQGELSPDPIETIDLTAGPVDYQQLLEAIFRAESIHVW